MAKVVRGTRRSPRSQDSPCSPSDTGSFPKTRLSETVTLWAWRASVRGRGVPAIRDRIREGTAASATVTTAHVSPAPR